MIKVEAKDISVESPVTITLVDKSGAHVVLTVSIRDLPPISHAFSYYEGMFSAKLDKLSPGTYDCSFTVQAYKYHAMNGMYDAKLQINGQEVSHVKGNIPSGETFDSGIKNFKLQVTK